MESLTLSLGPAKAPTQILSPPLKVFSGYCSFGLNFGNGNSTIKTSIRRSIIKVEAKKGSSSSSSNDRKVDTHSAVPKPDESTGPFPEAVLLKQKTVQEDGRVLPEFADEEEQELFEFLNLQLESDLNVDAMRHYEVVYLIHQDYKDKVEDVNSKIQDFLREKKGRVWRFSDWGMRRLAYKIRKATHAHYILMNFELGTQWINDFKQMLDQDERVIRHLVIKRDKAITEDCPPPPEFNTLRADMTDEYDVDDYDEDAVEDDDDDDWYEEDEGYLEGYEDDDGDVEEVSTRSIGRGPNNQKADLNKGKENPKREKAFL